MLGETRKPILPRPRSAQYGRAREKQIPAIDSKSHWSRGLPASFALSIASAAFLALVVPETDVLGEPVPPIIMIQSQRADTDAGQAVFGVSALGTAPLSYQWQCSGTNIPGATDVTYILSNVSSNYSGLGFNVVVSSAYGTVTSAVVGVAQSTANTLNGMGNNNYGKLGTGDLISRTSPVLIASNVVSAAAGYAHSLFVKGDGTLWAMGWNNVGQLGAGNSNWRSSPDLVVGNVVSAAAGYVHSLFVKGDGTLWAMGSNNSGQLGTGAHSNTTSPDLVVVNVVSAAAGYEHSLFVKWDGTLWAMGDNSYGQLGTGGTGTITSWPVLVTSNVVSAAAGYSCSLFVRGDGTLWAMGYNAYGQLGTGDTINRTSPVLVTSNVVSATAGYSHSLFVRGDGTLWAMGNNGFGQLGTGDTVSRTSPVLVAGSVVSAAAGYSCSLFVRGDGMLWAMGGNDYGQLGTGDTVNRTVPVPVTGNVVSAATSASAFGDSFSFFLQQPLTFFSPVLQPQPFNQVATLGSNVTITATAAGASLSYQWQCNGSSLAGATNSALNLANVQLTNAGAYSVIISNAYGSVSSSNALLQVLSYGTPIVQVNNQLAVGTFASGGPAQVTLSGGYPDGVIFYTLDGTTPNFNSPIYYGPVTLTNNAPVQALSFSADLSQSALSPLLAVQVLPLYALLTSVAGNGAVSLTPAQTGYASNSSVILTATAAPNWAFDHWTGDMTGNLNSVSITMNGPRSVQAVFVQTAYRLTVSTPGGGSVLANGQTISDAYYPTGSVVAVSAIPGTGWTFMDWQGDASGTNSPLGLVITQAYNVQAVFGTFVSTNVLGNGAIALNFTNPVPFGTALTATALPAPGNYLVTWAGVISGTNSPITVIVTNPAPFVSAIFARAYVPVAITSQPGSQVIRAGETATLFVGATGGPSPQYQWYEGLSSNTNGIIVGATNANYTATGLASTASFWVRVSNPFSMVDSAIATVTVVPQITPRLNLTIISGLAAVYVDGLVGTQYLVQYSTNLGGTNWTTILDYNQNVNPYVFIDSASYGASCRFYRVVAH